MTKTTEYGAASYRAMTQRLINAETSFLEQLTTAGDLTEEQAKVAFAKFKQIKILKLDLGVGRYTVKHGAFWDRAVVRRAAGIEE